MLIAQVIAPTSLKSRRSPENASEVLSLYSAKVNYSAKLSQNWTKLAGLVQSSLRGPQHSLEPSRVFLARVMGPASLTCTGTKMG